VCYKTILKNIERKPTCVTW